MPVRVITKSHKLRWAKLLDAHRVRSYFGGPKSRVAPGDLRTEFERDYGRTIYSTPFRRLRDKAQVFPLEPNDSVRTRLLHSLEVSTVAEDLAAQTVRDVIAVHEKTLSEDDLRAIPLVAATCGLIHDIGNPPFGHAGELAIQSWFRNRFGNDGAFLSSLGGEKSQMARDFFLFEGNAQGVRTVSNTFLIADRFGLNFTTGTLSAALKYVARSDQINEKRHEMSKPGYFSSENEIVAKVREVTGTLDCRHPIAYIVEAADDIVYCAVDLEDGLRRGTLIWDEVEKTLLNESGNADIVKKVMKQAHAHVRPAKLRGKELADALAQAFRIAAISLMAIEARRTFKQRYCAIVDGEYHQELVRDPECGARPLIEASKNILRRNLYTHSDVLSLEVRGRQVIHELLDLFWEGVSCYDNSAAPAPKTYGGKLCLLFSPNYRRSFETRSRTSGQSEMYLRLQLVADQISGMTDTYCCRLHKNLTNR